MHTSRANLAAAIELAHLLSEEVHVGKVGSATRGSREASGPR
jgi:hypothetical protein